MPATESICLTIVIVAFMICATVVICKGIDSIGDR